MWFYWYCCSLWLNNHGITMPHILSFQLEPLRDKKRSRDLHSHQGIFKGLQCCVLEGHPCYMNSDCCFKTCTRVPRLAFGMFARFLRILMCYFWCDTRFTQTIHIWPPHWSGLILLLVFLLGTKICNSSISSQESRENANWEDFLSPLDFSYAKIQFRSWAEHFSACQHRAVS